MTQIMHGIVVVTLSDTSAWKKNPPDPTPQFPKLADLNWILSKSLYVTELPPQVQPNFTVWDLFQSGVAFCQIFRMNSII